MPSLSHITLDLHELYSKTVLITYTEHLCSVSLSIATILYCLSLKYPNVPDCNRRKCISDYSISLFFLVPLYSYLSNLSINIVLWPAIT